MAEAVEQPPHVFALVSAAHLLIVAVVAFSGWLQAWRRPLPELLHVRLVTLPSPVRPTPEPGVAESVTPAVPAVPPAPELPAPARVTVPAQPAPAVVAPPARKTWKPRTAAEIRNTASAQPRISDSAPARMDIDASQLATRLRERVEAYGVPKIVTSSGQAAGASSARYFEAITAYLHDSWKQPNRAEIGERRPRAAVQLTVQANGRVTGARLSGPSGVAAMDESVRHMLSMLQTLPAPRDYGIETPDLTLTVSFEVN